MVPEARVVVDRRWETADTVTLTLAPRGETDAVAPRPGQFLMLSAFGVGEVPISVSGLGRPGGAVPTPSQLANVIAKIYDKID